MFILPKNIKRHRGAALVEYALLAALVAIAGIASVSALGKSIECSFTKTGNAVAAGNTGQGINDTCDSSGGGLTGTVGN
jgi:Flp pilus assembly pilin Flp